MSAEIQVAPPSWTVVPRERKDRIIQIVSQIIKRQMEAEAQRRAGIDDKSSPKQAIDAIS